MTGFFGRLLGLSDESADALTGAKVRRRHFSGDVAAVDPASDAAFELVKGDPFEAERSYFSVRIAEMRLAQSGNYISRYLPMCCCFLRYTYGNARREVPYIVSYDMIRAALGKDAPEDGSQNVDFKNIYVVRNAPVKSDNLLMYTALCRVADSTFARGMLDLVGDAAGVVGGPAAGTVVKAGVDMAKRLGSLLGSDGVSTRFGVLDGRALTKSGYRVIAGANDTLDAKELTIDHDVVVMRGADGQTTDINNLDYLVIALEYKRSLIDESFSDIALLPFHELWEPVREKIITDDMTGADEAYKKLMLRVAASPDLVEADRIGVLTAYRGEAERWKQTRANIGSLKAGSSEDITTQIFKVTQENVANLSQPTLSLLKTAGGLIGDHMSQKTKDIGEAGSIKGLSDLAGRARQAISDAKADTRSMSEASTQLLSIAIGSSL